MTIVLDITVMATKQGIDPDPPAIIERWYHRICSRCKLDSVYVYPAGQGPLPMWPEPCVQCGWVPGSAIDRKEGKMFAIGKVTQRLNDERIDEIGCIDAGKAFLYLYRRFGPPFAGSDSHKDVCVYYIDTSLKDVQVIVHIGGNRAYLGVAAGMKVQWRYNEYWLEDGGTDNTSFMTLVEEAIENGIRDLLRPVYVRDVPITLLGQATQSELGEYLEDEERHENEVPRSAMAGYGIPHDLYECPDLFFVFVRLLKEWGGGDIGKGMERVIERQEKNST